MRGGYDQTNECEICCRQVLEVDLKMPEATR
jgi:hypothetical protein